MSRLINKMIGDCSLDPFYDDFMMFNKDGQLMIEKDHLSYCFNRILSTTENRLKLKGLKQKYNSRCLNILFITGVVNPNISYYTFINVRKDDVYNEEDSIELDLEGRKIHCLIGKGEPHSHKVKKSRCPEHFRGYEPNGYSVYISNTTRVFNTLVKVEYVYKDYVNEVN